MASGYCIYFYLGMAKRERSDGAGEFPSFVATEISDPEQTTATACCVLYLEAHAVDTNEYIAGSRHYNFSGWCERYVTTFTFKQVCAYFTFKCFDLLGDSGLRNMTALGSASKAFQFNNSLEVFELA